MDDTEYKIESTLSGFIIAPDAIIEKHGVVVAAVYGRVWRYAQQKNKVCYASIDTIAENLRLSRSTVIRHLKTLKDAGYLIDLTPELRNKPHTYKLSGKVKLVQKTEIIIEDEPLKGRGVSKRNSGCFNLELEDSNKIEIKNKQTKNVCRGEVHNNGSNGNKNNNHLQLEEKKALKKASALEKVHPSFRALGQAFLEYAGMDYLPTSGGDLNLWNQELKIWASIGANANMVKAVVADMRKSGLSIKSPASLTGMLRNYKATRAIQDDKVFSSFDEELY